MRKRILLAAIALTLLLASCSQSAASPTATAEPGPTATATTQPTATVAVATGAKEAERVSRFGTYKGYSERIYDGHERFSQYVEARDGTLLAVDVYRPTVDGELVEEQLPVVWAHTRYQRATQRQDGTVQEGIRYVRELLPYGYVVGIVDVRGSGASFGVRTGEYTPEEAQDAYDITEWLAAQPWSDGNVGMFGRSYLGVTQLFASSQAPPHLRAIFPEMHMFDIYDLVYQNGIYMSDFVQEWDQIVRGLDASTLAPVALVDNDPGGEMLAEALALREQNAYPLEVAPSAPYRDSPLPGAAGWAEISPDTYIDAINTSGIAVYQLGGWFDMYTRDPMLWYVNLRVPHRLVMADWPHTGFEPWLPVEVLRWFDYWLKGINNGIMEEPSLTYRMIGENVWRTADQWPLPNEQRTPFYFHAGPSSSVDSGNDGLLLTQAPGTLEGRDNYTVNYATTVGPTNRFAAGYGGEFSYPNLVHNDKRALTYTTPPLENDVEVTGHPVAHLWASSTAVDGDFYVYLEEVSNRGYSHYVSEGKLRASHRALHEPPYENMGLPWHRSHEEDITPLPQREPVELVFDLRPTAIVFDAGHRIRITLTGADAATFETPQLNPAPTISIYRNAGRASYIELPIIP